MEKVLSFLRHLFVPHENNNFRARTLHPDFLGFYLILAIMLSFSFKQIGLNNVLGFATDITAGKLFELTNSEREKNGLPVLSYNDKLAAAASSKAQNMFNESYWAHYSPTGKTPWNFISEAGYQYEFAGENLAKNFLFSDGVVSAWMASTTHRDNILKREYTEVGYAIVNGMLNGEETTLVVQMFGKPVFGTVSQQNANPGKADTVPAPSINPQAAKPVENIEKSAMVLSRQSEKKTFNLPAFSFNINMVFFAFLLVSLGLDFYFASRYNVLRIGGKNLAHFLFVVFMFMGLLIISRGAII